MHVDAAASRDIQHRLRQYQSVGGNDQQVGLERLQFVHDTVITQRRRLQDAHSMFQGKAFHRTLRQAFAAPRRSIRLRKNRDRHDAGGKQCRQGMQRELRRAGENHPGIFHDEVASGFAVYRWCDNLTRQPRPLAGDGP